MMHNDLINFNSRLVNNMSNISPRNMNTQFNNNNIVNTVPRRINMQFCPEVSSIVSLFPPGTLYNVIFL